MQDTQERIVSALRAAGQAQLTVDELAARLESLANRGIVSPRAVSAVERVPLMGSRLRAGLAQSLATIEHAADNLSAGLQTQLPSVLDAGQSAIAATDDLLGEISDLSQGTIALLADGLQQRVQARADDLAQALADAVQRVESHWSDLASQTQEQIETMLGEGSSLIDGEILQLQEQLEQRLHRCEELKHGLEQTMAKVERTVALFTDSMRAAQTGLNATAGSVKRISDIFDEIA